MVMAAFACCKGGDEVVAKEVGPQRWSPVGKRNCDDDGCASGDGDDGGWCRHSAESSDEGDDEESDDEESDGEKSDNEVSDCDPISWSWIVWERYSNSFFSFF